MSVFTLKNKFVIDYTLGVKEVSEHGLTFDLFIYVFFDEGMLECAIWYSVVLSRCITQKYVLLSLSLCQKMSVCFNALKKYICTETFSFSFNCL